MVLLNSLYGQLRKSSQISFILPLKVAKVKAFWPYYVFNKYIERKLEKANKNHIKFVLKSHLL